METGYAYNQDTNEILAIITAETQDAVLRFYSDNYADDANALTYSPAVGTNDGLIFTDRTQLCGVTVND